MSRQKLAAFRRRVLVEMPAQQGKEARALLLRTAKEGNERILKEQTARAGVKPGVTAYANRPGRPVDQVELPGPIVYQYSYRSEIVKVALQMLRAASPVISGEYKKRHTLYVNGTSVAALPDNLKAGDDLYISNPLPYVRKIEIGKTKAGRDFVIQVPNRIYERVAEKLRSRYGNVARIYSHWVVIKVGEVADWAASPSGQRARANRGGSVRTAAEWAQRQPAIFIEALT